MQKEYGCNELMMDGGYCTSIGDVVCLCDECQRKIIEKIELLEGAKTPNNSLNLIRRIQVKLRADKFFMTLVIIVFAVCIAYAVYRILLLM